jgi:hypothetical protein
LRIQLENPAPSVLHTCNQSRESLAAPSSHSTTINLSPKSESYNTAHELRFWTLSKSYVRMVSLQSLASISIRRLAFFALLFTPLSVHHIPFPPPLLSISHLVNCTPRRSDTTISPSVPANSNISTADDGQYHLRSMDDCTFLTALPFSRCLRCRPLSVLTLQSARLLGHARDRLPLLTVPPSPTTYI